MAFQLIGQPITINNYTGDMKPTLIAKYVCDTPSDLPARVQADYIVGLGSSAYVVSNAGEYMIQTDGSWQLQVAGTVTYTKVEIDTLLSYKANTSSVYTKTQTDNLLNAKADASSVYTITQVDNLLSDKITISDVFSTGVSLASYNSLDNLTPGNYYAENGTVAGNVHAPYTRSGFNLWVIATTGNSRPVQLLFPNPYGSEYNTKGFFLFRQNVAGNWEDWHTVTDSHGLGNAVVVGASGIDMDTLKTEGVWYAASTTGAQASTGRPDYDVSGAKVWRLDVYKLYSTRAWQELTVYRLGASEGDFDKYFRINKTDDTWTDWQHIDTTVVATYRPS